MLLPEGEPSILRRFLKVWEMIDGFKERCRSKGWNVFENDVVEAKDEYNRFVWPRRLNPETFRRVVSNPSCALQDGVSHREVELSYVVRLLSETPPEGVWRVLEERPSLSKRVSLYDLSRARRGGAPCPRMNNTGSVVLKEFELFLNTKYGISFSPFTKEEVVIV